MANHNKVDWTFFLFNMFEISFKIHNFKMKKTLLKELLLQNQEVCRMEISKLRPFLDPKFEDVKRRWKQDYSKKYWVISLSQREIRGKLIFTVLIDVFYLFLETSVFYDKTWQVETVDNSHLYTHCLEMNFYVNFWGGINSNGFHIKWIFGTQDNGKN